MRVENRRVPCSSNSMTVWCSFTSTIVPAPYCACTTRSPAAYLRMSPPRSVVGAIAAPLGVCGLRPAGARARNLERDVQRLFDDPQPGQLVGPGERHGRSGRLG